jgi:hypothetical protein
MEEVVNKSSKPCLRKCGSRRAHFPRKESAEAFAEKHEDYYGDLPRFCGKCLRWHLIRIEWLVPNSDRWMTSVN